MNQNAKPIALAMSGGGARGFMHLGVLRAMEEQGRTPSHLSACSMGAVIAVLYGAGHSAAKIESIFQNISVISSIGLSGIRGLLSLRPFVRKLSPYLPSRLEDLEIPVIVNVTDLLHGKPVYFSEGELIPILMASCSVPFFFPPISINGGLMADGGILDNLPINSLPKSGYERWASACNATDRLDKLKGLPAIMERTLRMAINQNTLLHRKSCEVVIDPVEMGRFRMTHFKRRKEMAAIGYQSALGAISASAD